MLQRCFLIILCACCLVSCRSVLPKEHTITSTHWQNFGEIKTAYDKVVIDKTNRRQLHALGFNPQTDSNIRIENYHSIQKRFDPRLSHENLPPAIAECVQKGNQCNGYYLDVTTTDSKRVGNAFLDVLNFKRVTHTHGWHFQALFILIDNKVVFKLWNGSPNIRKYITEINPLGPLQDGIDVGVSANYNLNN